MRLNKKVAKLIAHERVCRVATAGPEGRPQYAKEAALSPTHVFTWGLD